MFDFLSGLSWQHQIVAAEFLVSMVVALVYIQRGHVSPRREHAFWAVWDAANIMLFLTGGAHDSWQHILLLIANGWAFFSQTSRALGYKKALVIKKQDVKLTTALFCAAVAIVQILLLVKG